MISLRAVQFPFTVRTIPTDFLPEIIWASAWEEEGLGTCCLSSLPNLPLSPRKNMARGRDEGQRGISDKKGKKEKIEIMIALTCSRGAA